MTNISKTLYLVFQRPPGAVFQRAKAAVPAGSSATVLGCAGCLRGEIITKIF